MFGDSIGIGKCLIAAANPDLMESYIEENDLGVKGKIKRRMEEFS